jgi:hypothetical protein
VSTYNFEKIILAVLRAIDLNFNEFKSRGMHEKKGVVFWILVTIPGTA